MQNCTKKKVHCAVCSQPGLLECKYCHYSIYCSEKHLNTDWQAIHQEICGSLKQLQKPVPIFVTDIERQQYKDRLIDIRHNVLKICKEKGKKLLFMKNYKKAIPVVMQELRWVTEIYGVTSAEIIPTYCRIIEGCLGNGRLEQAQDYMTQALWCLEKGEVTNAVKFSLYKVLGRISEAKNQVEETRDALAEHIFYAAEQWGPESIQTMWGYLHLGLSFLDKSAAAYSFFAKVIKVANLHLTPIVNAYFCEKEAEEFTYHVEDGAHSLSEQLEMMVTVRNYMEKNCRKYITLFEVTALFLVLGILHHFCATNKSVPYLEQVIEITEKLKHYESVSTTAKKLLNKEQLRLREWLRNKMAEAQIWEGLPGTWHEIDACFASSKESHSEMMKYYNMIDEKNSQAKKEIKPLATKIMMKANKRETAGKDMPYKNIETDKPKIKQEISDEEEEMNLPARSLSGSADSPNSLYYLSYIK